MTDEGHVPNRACEPAAQSADDELAQLRRLAVVEELLTTLVGVLDIREVFTRVSEVAGRVLQHDALALPVFTRDGLHAIPLATAGPAAAAFPSSHPVPETTRYLLSEPWEFEIVDLDAEPEREPRSASLGYRSMLRVPVRLQGDVVALLVLLSRMPAAYRPSDALTARRIADYVALALSHEQLVRQAQSAGDLRRRTATLELLDDLLTTLVDTGELPDVFDRVSEIARKVLPHDTLAMTLVLPDRRRARVYASSGVEGEPFAEVFELPEHYVSDEKWDHVITNDLPNDPVFRDVGGAAKRGYRSALRVAIRVKGELAGALVFFSFRPSAYTEADLLVARRIRDCLALHVTQGRGAEAARRAADATARASRLEMRVRALTEELNARAGYRCVFGTSSSWRQTLTEATQVAATETTVLLQGQSGTGKEVVARFIHRASERRDGPFVAVNCAALPEHLLEAELFGYERGAFTGATQSKPGQLEQAGGGVLFLDEVAEMSTSAQAKFLRVLQEREFQRLGGTRVLRTDVRVIAASNRDLRKAIERGHFREDLYYRLNVFAIHLPPLRDRREDVRPLTQAFITDIGQSIGRPPAGISRAALQALVDYDWPGNVRELRNVLERAAILCDGGLIATEHLALGPSSRRSLVAVPAPPSAAAAAPPPAAAPGDLKSVERALIVKALADARLNKSKAARALGLTRAQLYVRLRKHGLGRDDEHSH